MHAYIKSVALLPTIGLLQHLAGNEPLTLSAFRIQVQNQECLGKAVLSIALPVSTHILIPPVTASR